MGSVPPQRPPPPTKKFESSTPPSVKQHFEHLNPLSAFRVRWFYQEEKKWIPFNGYDSLNIEQTYRGLPESLRTPLLIPSDVDRSSISLPTVRGALYEADILDRECRPIFWNETAVPIMRGTWFKGNITDHWEPIDEKQSIKIEETHAQVVRSLGVGTADIDITNTSSDNDVIHQIKIGVNRIEWHDLTEIYMKSESTGSRFAQKIGLSGATKIHRGYEFLSKEEDNLSDINHIVFLIHGMGQLYHGDGGIIHSRKKFSDAIEKANKKYFKNVDGEASSGRVEFFPIEWRSKLKLDEGIIDMITPQNLGSLRKVINDTTLDVFYYTSPFYREEIIQAIRTQLNAVYKQFCDRNPSFKENNGKVSIVAHSLGSVIVHDVLTLWNSFLIEEGKKNADTNVAIAQKSYSWFWGWGKPRENLSEESLSDIPEVPDKETLQKKLHEARLKVAKLEDQLNGMDRVDGDTQKSQLDCYSLLFKVEYVFNIGSPLGVFLTMRGIRPRTDVEQHILPTSVCKRTFNIYDPADPVAYRLEPLIYDYYAKIPPVRLAHVGPSGVEPTTSKFPTPPGGGWLKSIFGSRLQANDNPLTAVEYQGSDKVDIPKATFEKTEETLQDKKKLDPRLDYVLEQSMVEYFSAITSHQGYWHNPDFAKFVLQVLYESGDIDSSSDIT